MTAPQGTLYDREFLLDMVYCYALYENELGEARVISALTEIYGENNSIEKAIKSAKFLIEDERKFMKRSPAGESPANPAANASNENLLTAFPNPFNPATTIHYTLYEPGNVTLKIYNTKGQQVALLVDGHQQAGVHNIVFNTTDLPSGVYFCHLSGKDINVVKKIMLLK